MADERRSSAVESDGMSDRFHKSRRDRSTPQTFRDIINLLLRFSEFISE
jgi:hypothetical protein